MNNKLVLLIAMLLNVSPALAINELDPNLSVPSTTQTEGRVLECQKCEATQASPVARHADSESATSNQGVQPPLQQGNEVKK